MSNSPFDFTLPFAPFAPFASLNVLPPPAQRWLDVLTDASQAMSDAITNAVGLQGPLYQRLLARRLDPFNPIAWRTPSVPLDWTDTCSRASAVMSKALSHATQRQMELAQSWLAAQQQFTSTTDTSALHDRIEWLHGQTTQTVAQLREINDEYLEAWFAAAGIMADAWPTAASGEHADPAGADASKTKPAASRATTKRS